MPHKNRSRPTASTLSTLPDRAGRHSRLAPESELGEAFSAAASPPPRRPTKKAMAELKRLRALPRPEETTGETQQLGSFRTTLSSVNPDPALRSEPARPAVVPRPSGTGLQLGEAFSTGSHGRVQTSPGGPATPRNHSRNSTIGFVPHKPSERHPRPHALPAETRRPRHKLQLKLHTHA